MVGVALDGWMDGWMVMLLFLEALLFWLIWLVWEAEDEVKLLLIKERIVRLGRDTYCQGLENTLSHSLVLIFVKYVVHGLGFFHIRLMIDGLFQEGSTCMR